MSTTPRLHLLSPVASSLAIAERGFCGNPTRALVGTWRHRAVLFIRRSEWALLCVGCRAQALAWMKTNGATEPIFSVEVQANADAVRTIPQASTAAELEALRAMANVEPVEGRDFEEMPARHRSGRAVDFGEEVFA